MLLFPVDPTCELVPAEPEGHSLGQKGRADLMRQAADATA